MTSPLKALATYRALFEQTHDLVFIVGLDGVYLHVNHRSVEILGYQPCEIEGKHIRDIVIPDEYDAAMRLMERVASGATLPPYERTLRHKDGHAVYVEMSVQLVRNEDGSPSHVQNVIRDISERKRAADALYASEQRFRTLLDALPVGVTVHGPQTEILLSNRNAQDLLGRTHEELAGKAASPEDWDVLREDATPFPPEDYPVVVAAVTRRPVRDVVMGVYRPATQDRVWLLVNAEPELHSDGSLNTIMLTFSDITALRQSQEHARQSDALLAAVFHDSPIAIVMVRLADQHIVDANEAFVQLFDTPRAQLIGRSASSLGFWPSASHRSRLMDQLQQEGRLHQVEMQYRDRGGTLHPALISAEYVSLNGEPHILGMVQDIQERKDHERAKAELVAKRRAIEALRGYMSHIAHDIRNPLAVMNTSLYLMRRKIDTGIDVRAHFTAMHQQIDNLTQVLESMAEAFRDEVPPDMTPIDLNAVAAQVMERCQPAAAARQQTLTLEAAPRPLNVAGSPERLERMLNHLVVNALQYTPAGGTIHISTTLAPREAVMEVRDSGVGIDPAHLPYVFDYFYRGDAHRPTEAGAAGLGLTIVKKIVEAHQGAVEVESEPGRGSTFRVRLPLV